MTFPLSQLSNCQQPSNPTKFGACQKTALITDCVLAIIAITGATLILLQLNGTLELSGQLASIGSIGETAAWSMIGAGGGLLLLDLIISLVKQAPPTPEPDQRGLLNQTGGPLTLSALNDSLNFSILYPDHPLQATAKAVGAESEPDRTIPNIEIENDWIYAPQNSPQVHRLLQEFAGFLRQNELAIYLDVPAMQHYYQIRECLVDKALELHQRATEENTSFSVANPQSIENTFKALARWIDTGANKSVRIAHAFNALAGHILRAFDHAPLSEVSSMLAECFEFGGYSIEDFSLDRVTSAQEQQAILTHLDAANWEDLKTNLHGLRDLFVTNWPSPKATHTSVLASFMVGTDYLKNQINLIFCNAQIPLERLLT